MTDLDPTAEVDTLVKQIAADTETIAAIQRRWSDYNYTALTNAVRRAGADQEEARTYGQRCHRDTLGIINAGRELNTQLDDLRYNLRLLGQLHHEATRQP